MTTVTKNTVPCFFVIVNQTIVHFVAFDTQPAAFYFLQNHNKKHRLPMWLETDAFRYIKAKLRNKFQMESSSESVDSAANNKSRLNSSRSLSVICWVIR